MLSYVAFASVAMETANGQEDDSQGEPDRG
jgi:hypothetical protein